MPTRFARVDKHVYRGGGPSARDLRILRDVYGVKKIVSLDDQVGHAISNDCELLGLNHVIIPLTDGNGPNVNLLPAEVLQWHKQGPVYVHCFHGKDRTGMTCAIYRILVNGWDTDKALQEAHKFGMGTNLSKSVANSYYEAVRDIADSDVSNSDDTVVDRQRDTFETIQPKPGMNDATQPRSMEQTFAPYVDQENDYLNRPASLDDLRRARCNRLIKQAKNNPIFIYTNIGKILTGNQIWTDSPEHARQIAGDIPDAQVFVGELSDAAEISHFLQEPVRTLVQAAVLDEADVAEFKGPNSPKQYVVINPAVIQWVKPFNPDINDVPLVGLHDNYTGMQPYSFPGSGGGFIGPVGGFAGMTDVPYGHSF